MSTIHKVHTMGGKIRYFEHGNGTVREIFVSDEKPPPRAQPASLAEQQHYYSTHQKRGVYGVMLFGYGYLEEVDTPILGQEDYDRMVRRCYRPETVESVRDKETGEIKMTSRPPGPRWENVPEDQRAYGRPG